MDITITGRGVGIPDRFEDYATEKSEKVAHLADKALALEIRVIRHHETGGSTGDDRVELTLIGPGPIVRAEAAGDKYAAFDIALDKLLERIRQAKDRRKVHRGARRPESLREATTNGKVADLVPASTAALEAVATGEIPVQEGTPEEADWSPVVIRNKVFPAARMSHEDAVDHMELVGHDFFLFIDAATDNPAVVYRRKGWNYGVISLEEQVDEVAVRRRG